MLGREAAKSCWERVLRSSTGKRRGQEDKIQIGGRFSGFWEHLHAQVKAGIAEGSTWKGQGELGRVYPALGYFCPAGISTASVWVPGFQKMGTAGSCSLGVSVASPSWRILPSSWGSHGPWQELWGWKQQGHLAMGWVRGLGESPAELTPAGRARSCQMCTCGSC